MADAICMLHGKRLVEVKTIGKTTLPSNYVRLKCPVLNCKSGGTVNINMQHPSMGGKT